MSRLSLGVLLAVVAFGLAVPSVAASPSRKLDDILAAYWSEVLTLPTADNPFTGGDACVDFGGPPGRRFLTPVAPAGVIDPIECTVKPGTSIFVTGWTSECSNIEAYPYFGEGEAELRACARAADAGITTTELTVDGQPVPLTEVETGLLNVVLAENNIFGLPPGTEVESVGHGWVVVLHPLRPGSHELIIRNAGTYVSADGPIPIDQTVTTTIIVKPRP